MKSTNYDHRALLDRLEKKYAKKLQTQKLKQQSNRLKLSLQAISGRPLKKLRRERDLFDYIDYETIGR